MPSAVLLLLRLTLGLVFISRGWRHARDPARLAAWVESSGLRRPRYQAGLIAYGELAIGLGFTLGLATAAACAGAVSLGVMVAWIGRRISGRYAGLRSDPGRFRSSVITLAAAGVAILGPGDWSLDHGIGWTHWTSGAIAIAWLLVGLVLAAGHLAAHHRRPA